MNNNDKIIITLIIIVIKCVVKIQFCHAAVLRWMTA